MFLDLSRISVRAPGRYQRARRATGGPRVLRAMGGAVTGWLALAALAATSPLAVAAPQATFVNLTLYPRLCVPTNDTSGACCGACARPERGPPHTQTHSARPTDPGLSFQTPDANGFFCSYAALGAPIHVCVPAANCTAFAGCAGGLRSASVCCAPPASAAAGTAGPAAGEHGGQRTRASARCAGRLSRSRRSQLARVALWTQRRPRPAPRERSMPL